MQNVQLHGRRAVLCRSGQYTPDCFHSNRLLDAVPSFKQLHASGTVEILHAGKMLHTHRQHWWDLQSSRVNNFVIFFIVCDKQLKFMKHTLECTTVLQLFPRHSFPLWLHYSCIANKLVMITWPLTFWPLCVCSQHTGMLHERSWSCLCWPASLASSLVLWPSSTTLPLTGLIKPLLQAFCSSSHVSWLFFLFYF